MITVYALAPFMPELKGVVRDIRALWTLEELGEPYVRKEMDSLRGEHKAPEYLALNPFGKVPCIQDGEFTLFESSAVCSYLGDKTGRLIPHAGTRARSVYDQWVSFTISTFEPKAGFLFELDYFMELEATAKAALRAKTLKVVDGQLATVDKILSGRAYLLGDSFSIVDILFSAVCRTITHAEIIDKHPHVSAYLTRNFERPAFLRARALHG